MKTPKRAIYTVVTGGYDEIVSPPFIDEGVDYLLFTDERDITVPEPWKKINFSVQWNNPVMMQRLAKITGTIVSAKNYDTTLYHDAYLHQVSSVVPLFEEFERKRPLLMAMAHPDRTCVYQEISACRRLKKANDLILCDQQRDYFNREIPRLGGLIASGVLVRSFTEEWKEFAKEWWKETRKHSHRDQISFAAANHFHPIKLHLVDWHKVIGPIFNKVPHKIKRTY